MFWLIIGCFKYLCVRKFILNFRLDTIHSALSLKFALISHSQEHSPINCGPQHKSFWFLSRQSSHQLPRDNQMCDCNLFLEMPCSSFTPLGVNINCFMLLLTGSSLFPLNYVLHKMVYFVRQSYWGFWSSFSEWWHVDILVPQMAEITVHTLAGRRWAASGSRSSASWWVAEGTGTMISWARNTLGGLWRCEWATATDCQYSLEGWGLGRAWQCPWVWIILTGWDKMATWRGDCSAARYCLYI